MTRRVAATLRPAIVFLLSAVCFESHAQTNPMDKRGGHPPDTRRASLEDLLQQQDWATQPPSPTQAAEKFEEPSESSEASLGPSGDEPNEEAPERNARPLAVQAPTAFVVSPRAPRDLLDAIDERNRIVDRARLFDTFDKIVKEEALLRKRTGILDAALKQQERAAENVDMINHPGATIVAPEAKAAARRVWEASANVTQKAQREWQEQLNKLQPMYDRVRPEIGPWLACYGRMRRTIRPDRRDTNRQSMIGILEGVVRDRSDFFEGRVLAALLWAYEGDAGAAEGHLRQACAEMGRHNLFGTPCAGDGCYAYLLLGRPDMVTDYIAVLRKLEAPRQTAFQCWLVGLNAMMMCRDSEAATYMQKALAKIDFHKRGKEVLFEESPLLGDAALFRATASSEAQRDADKARQILARAKPEWDAWQLLRARAAVAAADGDWPEALTQIDRCAESCPATLVEEVKAQREAYASQEQWFRSRPGKKTAAP